MDGGDGGWRGNGGWMVEMVGGGVMVGGWWRWWVEG